MKRVNLLAIIALVVAAISPLTYAEPDAEKEDKSEGHGKGRRARFGLLAKLRQLDLTEQQREQVRAILRENHPTMGPLMRQAMEERRELRRLVNTSPVNEPAIRAQAAKVAQLRTELEVKRAYTSERIRRILTPEQIAKLRELQAQFDRRMERMMERAEQHQFEDE